MQISYQKNAEYFHKHSASRQLSYKLLADSQPPPALLAVPLTPRKLIICVRTALFRPFLAQITAKRIFNIGLCCGQHITATFSCHLAQRNANESVARGASPLRWGYSEKFFVVLGYHTSAIRGFFPFNNKNII